MSQRSLKVDGRSVAYPEATSPAASKRARATRGSDTTHEREVRSHLHRAGFRFRKNLRLAAGDVTVRPDIVFSAQRVAVFLDGCFWHSCPDHGNSPRSNSAYWSAKLDANVARDARVTRALRAAGWEVLRYWEHESPTHVARQVAGAVKNRAGCRGPS